MERALMGQLVSWKEKPNRRPLLLNGARQVGKTWLLREFGRTQFDNVAYINFDGNPQMQAILEDRYDISRILRAMELQIQEDIVPGKTLLILDEIQECPKALTALKYFHEDAPNLNVAAAGSLLGLTVHTGTGFPVGKVDILDMFPMHFGEFLDAVGQDRLRALIRSNDWGMLQAFSGALVEQLRNYLFVGGMPGAVAQYAETGDFAGARTIQTDILRRYELDMSKHLRGRDIEAALSVWQSIPAHLGRENKRFVFGQIRESARARDYQDAITWLTQAEIVVRVPRVTKPGVPLSAYANSSFKLFLVDVGLLGAMVGIDSRILLNGNNIFTEFKGALAEQYVCQQLLAACSLRPFYWSAANTRAEVDFLAERNGTVFGLEVKAEENLRSKSLRAFHDKYPEVCAIRFSLSGYREQDWMKNFPLYTIQNAFKDET